MENLKWESISGIHHIKEKKEILIFSGDRASATLAYE